MRIRIHYGTIIHTIDAKDVDSACGTLVNFMHVTKNPRYSPCIKTEIIIGDVPFPGPSKPIIWTYADARYLDAMQMCREHIAHCMEIYESFYEGIN